MAVGCSYDEDQLALRMTLRKFIEMEIVLLRAATTPSDEFPGPKVKKRSAPGPKRLDGRGKFSEMSRAL
jgi:hypothetical protein